MHRNGGFILLALTLLCLGCTAGGGAIVQSTKEFPYGTGFVQRQFTFDGKPQTLWVFLPKIYTPYRKFPAIVFLHGLFEAGKGESCLAGGLGPVVAQNADTWPFITIFPQSTGTWRGSERDRLVIAALERAESEFAIDPDRVILAGLSYGALGTWQIGANHPDRFAALVPVSGHSATELVQRLVLLPVWAFDSVDDPVVKPQSSEEMCRELQQHGGVAYLTEFVGAAHDCWGMAVKQSDLVNWMLKQRRRPQLQETTVAGTDVNQ